MNVLLAGGGTGGHIEPAMNLADALVRFDPKTGITALGTTKGLETELVPARGYPLALIPPVPLPRKPSKDLVSLPSRIRSAVAQTQDVIVETNTDVVVGFGGYVSFPAYFAARRAKLPFVVHEANARPGLANRVGARFTPHVAENYAGSLPHAIRIGCPLRAQIADLDRDATRQSAAAFYDLDPARPTLLVFGGSQGAQRINAAVAGALPDLLAQGIQVLHAVGPKNVGDAAAAPGYRPLPFIERMDLAYAVADLAVCRSGAMTCAELAAVGLPAVYVPYPVGNGEQKLNAAPVVAAGGGLMIADADFTAASLLQTARPLLADPQQLQSMGERAAGYGIRDAAARLAALTMKACAGS